MDQIELRRDTSEDKIGEWEIALEASFIPCRMYRRGDQWVLLVPAQELERAEQVLEHYEEENREWEEQSREESLYRKTYCGIAVSALLLGFYAFTGPVDLGHRAFLMGGASAELIVRGQWWRSVTALFLHGDLLHVLSNAIAGWILCSAVCRLFGFGRGSFLVLISGSVGNLITAFLYQSGHYSIGFSTAVFGAAGLLGAWWFVHRRRNPFGRRRAWVSLVAVAALLGVVGTGANADLLAHLMGALTGCLVGFMATMAFQDRITGKVQAVLAALSLALVCLSWLLALGTGIPLWE